VGAITSSSAVLTGTSGLSAAGSITAAAFSTAADLTARTLNGQNAYLSSGATASFMVADNLTVNTKLSVGMTTVTSITSSGGITASCAIGIPIAGGCNCNPGQGVGYSYPVATGWACRCAGGGGSTVTASAICALMG